MAQTTAPATTAAATTSPVTLPPGVFTAVPTPIATLSQCQACANLGQCSGAYNNLPGKYCGKWLSSGIQQVCCCPSAATCAIPVKADKCQCIDPTKVKTQSGMPYWAWILIGIGAFILCAALCYCFCRSAQDEPAVYVQEPMYVNQYGQPVMVNGNYANAGGYGPGYGGGYGDGGLAAGVAVDPVNDASNLVGHVAEFP
ncbi:hypothetical protein SDRG_11580 [Saprolegnia diclina VS20]|uniref:Uncharacterized protein n=1 Tax=Saprolegnia diclina (strain VS20) TaxID=1156394 RepID=T0QBA9_SAPDV|nr:hypothetical protein SDRG_11580 [Saprolegnia diclina VS20]EQC30820.1 hypothetical protein SDRG_11580 [Saprolegnia diclina VS20]|eukprot:XP_008615844.1 hypothetical protein SDRG_11580 [Saprolegnia diclina VS20]